MLTHQRKERAAIPWVMQQQTTLLAELNLTSSRYTRGDHAQ
ncbi:hypothetical protein [Dyella sp. M7H15-1]|nr:hypothetical protein [Dyella sp. M7H15-1]